MNGMMRTIGRWVAVGAIAVLLAGAAAAPAAAVSVNNKSEANKEQIASANRLLAAGGDPTSVEFVGAWELSCDLGEEGVVSFGGND